MSQYNCLHRSWKRLYRLLSASSSQISLLALSCALLLVAACGGVARADDGIEVINEESTVAPIEVVNNEQVQSDSVPSAGGGVDEGKESAKAKEEQAEAKEAESTDKKVEEGSEEFSVEDVPDVGSPLGATRATLALTAYGNVSPTSTYAVYAAGLLKEVPYQNGHYVFLQDSNQSYCMVVGEGDSLSGLSNARWWRWYYAGTSLGYVLERGTGNVSVAEGRYTVLSDFEGYPALQQQGDEQFRREVMLYALVAVVMHVLYCIWTYELRGAHRSLG